MKPKEWLVKNGHIKEAGRGRMSREHRALIEDAMIADPKLVIEGFSVAKPSSTTAKPTVERTAPDTGMVDVPDIVRDPRDWDAFDDTGKRFAIGIKGVCENCRSSVTYCHCPYPVLRVDNDRVSVVTFKSKAKKGDG